MHFNIKKAWRKIEKQAHRSWSDVRTPLTYAAIAAAAAYTGGAALGLLGIGTGAAGAGLAGAAAGASGATGAAALGAATGAVTGVQANEARKATERAAEQQEQIAKQEAAENLRLAGLTPGEQNNFDTVNTRRYSSQYRRNLVTRDKSKKLNSSSSTLG